MQQSSLAVQACLKKEDAPTGILLIYFMTSLGGSIFIAIAQACFTHSLLSHFPKDAGFDRSIIVNAGATELRNLVPQ